MPLKSRLIRMLGFYLNYLFIPTIFVIIIVVHLLSGKKIEAGEVYHATVLSGKRELVYITERVRIMIGPDNIYYYNNDGKYTNAEANGAIIFDKRNLAIIYEDGAYYAGFKLEEK